MINSIPNIKYLAPSNKEELLSILEWAMSQKTGPIAIRLPVGKIISDPTINRSDYSKTQYKYISYGDEIVILALGNFLFKGKEISQLLEERLQHQITLINPLFITELDKESLEKLKEEHSMIITLEDGSLDGGFGEKISAYFSNSSMKILNFGAKKEFTDNIPIDELYQKYHLNSIDIVNDALKYI